MASRLKQDGYIPFSEYGRTNISVGGNTELKNGFNIGGNMSFTNAIQRGPLSGYGSATQVSASALSRVLFPGRNWDISGEPFEDPDTRANVFFLGDAADNPYYSARYNGLRSELNRIAASLNAGYDIKEWLNVNYEIGVNTYNDKRKEVTFRGSVGDAGIGQLITDDIYYQEIVDFGTQITIQFNPGTVVDAVTGEITFSIEYVSPSCCGLQGIKTIFKATRK